MKLTAIRSGLFIVAVDGLDVSSHVAEREAVESAVNQQLGAPEAVVEYRHDYAVRLTGALVAVALTGQAILARLGDVGKTRARALIGQRIVSARGTLRIGPPPVVVVRGLVGGLITMNEE